MLRYLSSPSKRAMAMSCSVCDGVVRRQSLGLQGVMTWSYELEHEGHNSEVPGLVQLPMCARKNVKGGAVRVLAYTVDTRDISRRRWVGGDSSSQICAGEGTRHMPYGMPSCAPAAVPGARSTPGHGRRHFLQQKAPRHPSARRATQYRDITQTAGGRAAAQPENATGLTRCPPALLAQANKLFSLALRERSKPYYHLCLLQPHRRSARYRQRPRE